ncbi:hypothetical protein J6590_078082 [Homalodisca vitripennis]|nr:hypothetical protein J6590_078082 [Homalodisca vitripennis]
MLWPGGILSGTNSVYSEPLERILTVVHPLTTSRFIGLCSDLARPMLWPGGIPSGTNSVYSEPLTRSAPPGAHSYSGSSIDHLEIVSEYEYITAACLCSDLGRPMLWPGGIPSGTNSVYSEPLVSLDKIGPARSAFLQQDRPRQERILTVVHPLTTSRFIGLCSDLARPMLWPGGILSGTNSVYSEPLVSLDKIGPARSAFLQQDRPRQERILTVVHPLTTSRFIGLCSDLARPMLWPGGIPSGTNSVYSEPLVSLDKIGPARSAFLQWFIH